MKPQSIINRIQKAIDLLEDIYSDKDIDEYIRTDIDIIIDQLMNVGMSVEMEEES